MGSKEFSTSKLFEDLDHWIYIQIGDDILHRPEFKFYVDEGKKLKLQPEQIPPFVLGLLFQKKIQEESSSFYKVKIKWMKFYSGLLRYCRLVKKSGE